MHLGLLVCSCASIALNPSRIHFSFGIIPLAARVIAWAAN